MSRITTRPVPRMSFEQYCAELDIDPSDTRTATVVQALYARLLRSDAALRTIDTAANESLQKHA